MQMSPEDAPAKPRINFGLIKATKNTESSGNFTFDRTDSNTNGIDAMQIYQDLWGSDTSSIRSGCSNASYVSATPGQYSDANERDPSSFTPEKNQPAN